MLGTVERVCFTLRVRPDRLEEYRARHRGDWPEMLDSLRTAGWANYSLFASADGLLVGYLETEDFAAAQRAMAETEVNTRWQTEMEAFFGERADEALTRLDEVFHLD